MEAIQFCARHSISLDSRVEDLAAGELELNGESESAIEDQILEEVDIANDDGGFLQRSGKKVLEEINQTRRQTRSSSRPAPSLQSNDDAALARSIQEYEFEVAE